jgi:serine/threonine protein kinase
MLSARLADYGEAYDLNSEAHQYIINNNLEDEFDSYNGTIKYAPPEILEGNLFRQSDKSDIFSFGVLIWEVFTERFPFENENDEVEFSLKIINEEINPLNELKKIEYLPGTPKEIDLLVDKCLSLDPNDRPTIDYVLEEIISIQKNHGFTNSTR